MDVRSNAVPSLCSPYFHGHHRGRILNDYGAPPSRYVSARSLVTALEKTHVNVLLLLVVEDARGSTLARPQWAGNDRMLGDPPRPAPPVDVAASPVEVALPLISVSYGHGWR